MQKLDDPKKRCGLFQFRIGSTITKNKAFFTVQDFSRCTDSKSLKCYCAHCNKEFDSEELMASEHSDIESMTKMNEAHPYAFVQHKKDEPDKYYSKEPWFK
jgi:hypothetical protein